MTPVENTNYAPSTAADRNDPAANSDSFVQDEHGLILNREDLGLLIDALDDLDRPSNPQRPFSPAFQEHIRYLRVALDLELERLVGTDQPTTDTDDDQDDDFTASQLELVDEILGARSHDE